MPDLTPRQALQAFAADRMTLAELEVELDYEMLGREVSLIVADPKSAAHLGQALLSRREASNEDCDDFLVEGAAYPIFEATSSFDNIDFWFNAPAAMLAYLADPSSLASDSDRAVAIKLIQARQKVDGLWDEENTTIKPNEKDILIEAGLYTPKVEEDEGVLAEV